MERGAAPRSIGDEFLNVPQAFHELQWCEASEHFHSHPVFFGASPRGATDHLTVIGVQVSHIGTTKSVPGERAGLGSSELLVKASHKIRGYTLVERGSKEGIPRVYRYRVPMIETPRLRSHPLTAAQQRTTIRPPPHGGRVPSRGGPPRAGSMLMRPFMHPGAA